MTVCSYASGLPIAHTHSPTRSVSESPSGATGRFLRVDFDQRDVGVGIDAEHASLQAAAVGELHHDPLGVLDHVVVRQNLSVAFDDEPAARLRADRRRTLRSGIGVVEGSRLRRAPAPAAGARGGLDVDDRRVDALGDVGEIHEARRGMPAGRLMAGGRQGHRLTGAARGSGGDATNSIGDGGGADGAARAGRPT